MAGKKQRTRHIAPSDNDLIPPTLVGLARLLDDLHVIREEHPELYDRVYELIGWLLMPEGFIWSGPNKKDNQDRIRHAVSRHRLDLGDKWDADEAFENAKNDLKDHPAARKASTMRKSFQDIEKELPAELRRPRTCRRKPKTGGSA